MKPDDETLMAYADGELDANDRAEVEAAIAQDPEVAAAVTRHRALRVRLRAAFDDVLQEPVPDRLVQAARAAGPAGSGAVVDLAQARSAKAERSGRRWSAREWGAMAACVVAGVLVARVIPFGGGAADGWVRSANGELVARGSLARALTEQPSGQPGLHADVIVTLSFRAKSGEYCRAFVARDARAFGGLACRDEDDDGWRLPVLAEGGQWTASPNAYRMAAAELPHTVIAAVEATIDGEALDAEAERQALATGWRPR